MPNGSNACWGGVSRRDVTPEAGAGGERLNVLPGDIHSAKPFGPKGGRDPAEFCYAQGWTSGLPMMVPAAGASVVPSEAAPRGRLTPSWCTC